MLADGTLVTTGGAPRAAVGPDLTQLFVGSEGTLGVIVGARLRVHPLPGRRGPRRVRVRVVHRGLDAMRRIVQRGATPAVLRLYDAIEADRSYQTGDANVLLVLDEGDAHIVDATMRVVAEECAAAEPIDVALVEQWIGHRNDVSALEALDRSAASSSTRWRSPAPWRALPEIYDAHDRGDARASSTRSSRPRTRATRTPTAAASTSRSRAGRPRTNARRTTARSGTRGSARCSRPAARSATTTASASTAAASCAEALGAGVRRAADR